MALLSALRYVAYGASAVALMLSASGAFARLTIVWPYYLAIAVLVVVAGLAYLVTRGPWSRSLSGVGQLQALAGLLLFSNLAVQTSGGISSPLVPLYYLLGIVLCWRFGILAGVVGGGLVAVCETAALFTSHKLPEGLDSLLTEVAYLFAFTVGVGATLRRSEARSESAEEKLKTIEAGAESIAPSDEDVLRRLQAGAAPQPPAADLAVEAVRLDRHIGSLVELARQSVGAYTALYFSVEEDGGLRLRAHQSASEFVEEGVRLASNDNYLGLAVSQGKPIHLQSLSPVASRGVPYYLKFEGIKALLAVPVRVEGVIEGVLAVDSAQRESFVDEEREILESIAAQIETIYQLARLQQLSGRTEALIHQLYEADRGLSQSLDRDSILDQWLSSVQRLVRADSAYVAFEQDPPTDESGVPNVLAEPRLSVWYARGFRPDFSEVAEFDLRAGLIATVLSTGNPLVVDRPGETFRMPGGAIGSYAPIGSCMLLPVSLDVGAGRTRRGILQINSRNAEHFGPFDTGTVRILSDHATLVLRNAELYKKMESLATTDGLTGLPNHRTFQERLAEELVRAGRTGRPLCLVLVDIDHFKRFNDSFGHQEGDRVLQRMAALLREGVRKSLDMAARYGGEEFVLVLPEQEPGRAFEVADRIRRFASERLRGGDAKEQIPITLSMGLASFPGDAAVQSELIERADQALYHSKRHGRNRVTLYGTVRVRAEGAAARELQPKLF